MCVGWRIPKGPRSWERQLQRLWILSLMMGDLLRDLLFERECFLADFFTGFVLLYSEIPGLPVRLMVDFLRGGAKWERGET